MTDLEPIKLSCSLCGADWEGHDVCPVERRWRRLYNAFGVAFGSVVILLTYAALFR